MNYAKVKTSTAAKVRKAGKPCALIKTAAGSFDPVAGRDTGPVVTRFEGHALESSYSAMERVGTSVQATDRRMLCVDIPEPHPQDRIEVGIETLSVISVSRVAPGDTVILWEVQVR